MPKEICVFRSGTAVWLEIDGQALPVDWVDSVLIDIDVESDFDAVTVRLIAEKVHVESHALRPLQSPDEEADEDAEDTVRNLIRVPDGEQPG